MSRWRVLTLVSLLAGGVAAAEPANHPRRITVDVPPTTAPLASISHVIVLDRCKGGCRVTKGMTNKATEMTSTIPQGAGPFTLGEFQNATGETGAAADAEWTAVVTCVREVYSQFDVSVVDTRPVDSTYHLALVAGAPGQAGLGSDILGIAPLSSDCSAQDNVISFSFANAHVGGDRVNNLCWTVAQESAHAFGLDHEFMFTDGQTTCTDPMTYQTTCGGQRFFRNKVASCGEFAARPCKCGQVQNSHQKLLSVFGPGQTLIAAPTSKITFPQPNGAWPVQVAAMAGSQRGVSKVELILNGSPWAKVAGLPAGLNGQANPGAYMIPIPGNVPKSVVDIVVRASDDLGASTDSAVVTVTNGMPCTDAAGCLEHQSCEAGRCSFAQPVGESGDSCEYPQFCKSNMCVNTTNGKFCSEDCTPEADPSSCPDGLTCEQTTPGAGLCLPPGDAGCCSASTSGGPWVSGGLALLVLGCMSRRRGRFAGVRTATRKRDESC